MPSVTLLDLEAGSSQADPPDVRTSASVGEKTSPTRGLMLGTSSVPWMAPVSGAT